MHPAKFDAIDSHDFCTKNKETFTPEGLPQNDGEFINIYSDNSIESNSLYFNEKFITDISDELVDVVTIQNQIPPDNEVLYFYRHPVYDNYVKVVYHYDQSEILLSPQVASNIFTLLISKLTGKSSDENVLINNINIKNYLKKLFGKITGKAISNSESEVTYYYSFGSLRTKNELISIGVQTYPTDECSNNVVEISNNEECDDGNIINGDGCNSKCILEFAPPAARSNLKATPIKPIQASDLKVNLQWQDNSITENGFIIERVEAIKDTSTLLAKLLNKYKINGQWHKINIIEANAGIGTVYYTDSKTETNNLVPFSSYFYRVKAFNNLEGESDYSNQALTTTYAFCTDSDIGKIYNVAGTATSNAPKPYYSTITDSCMSTVYLQEASCTNEGIISITSYKCPSGCATTVNGGKCN